MWRQCSVRKGSVCVCRGEGGWNSRELSGLKGAGKSHRKGIVVISNQPSPAGCHSVPLPVVPLLLFSSFFLFRLFLYLCSIPSSSSGCSSTFVQFLFPLPVVPLPSFNSFFLFRLFLYLCSVPSSSTCLSGASAVSAAFQHC